MQSDSADEVISNNLPGDEVIDDKNDDKMGYILNIQCDNIDKQLMDAQTLIETKKLEQLQLIKELESVQTENQHLMKMMERNQYPTVSIEGSGGTSILALQAKLEKLSKELKEARILNKQYIDDHATRLSQDHQTELVRSEVEMETTRTIIYLQEEIDRLQSEFHVCLCSVAEENLSLRNSVAAKEDELRVFCAEWERATLELTTFLIDGSRSLGDASRQIKSISSSFPNVNDWINEHVERAAKMCVAKEATILQLQNSLEDAQNTVMQMEQKLYSLRGATIALTDFQQSEKSSRREEIQLSRMPNDLTEVKEFPENKPVSKMGQIPDNQAKTPVLVENRISDCSTSTPRGTFVGNLPLAHTNAFETTDVDIQIKLASLLAEIENAVNGSCADAETYWFALNSEIHDAVSLYKELVQDLLKDVSDIRKDVEELKTNRVSLHLFSNTIPSHLPLRHENQLPILQQVRNELVEINNRLSSMSACFYKFVNMHCNPDSTEVFTDTDGWTTDCLSSCSSASVGSFDNDEKRSSSDGYRYTSKITEQTLVVNSDEESNSRRKTAVLLFRKEFRETYEAFVKLKNQLMAVSVGKANQNCEANVLSFPDLYASEKLNEQDGDGLDQPTRKSTEACIKNFGEVSN